MHASQRISPLLIGLTAALGVGFAGSAAARDYISIVGSSTVYPFATVVAENFGKTTRYKTPKIESTGSGGGLKLFCAGIGVKHPDVTNSSRAIMASEVKMCQKNGVADIIEVKIGYDGIAVANSRKGRKLDIARKDLFLALAKDVPDPSGAKRLVANPYKTWRDVNRKYKSVCHTVREDGAYVEAGENDNLIVQKLIANPNALGVFGFSFLDQNSDKVQGSRIDGVAPEFETIADGSYPVSRPLFFYVKKAHVGTIPGMKEYLAEFTSDKAWGEEGYLSDRGLIPMPADERRQYAQSAKKLQAMQ
jgi:phosphate transport system substrate-binding protein